VLAVSFAAGLYLLAPCVAHAQPDELTAEEREARKKDAAQRYKKGAAAYKEGRYKDAIDLFLEADALAPSSALSFNIARAYDKIKDSANALRWYRDYLRREPQAEDEAQVSEIIAGYEQSLQKKGVQQLTVLSEPAGATVLVDKRPVGVTPWTGELPPGTHEVSLSLRGYADSRQTVELAADKAQDVNFRLLPGQSAPPDAPDAQPAAASAPASPQTQAPTPEADVPPGEQGIRPLTYVVLGAGVATLGAAGVFEISRRSAERDAKKETTQLGYKDAYDTMEQRQTVSRVLAGVGGALVIGGGVLLTLDLTRGSSQTAFGGGCVGRSCWVTANGMF
jgi:tetratricopeptide (TPR) repeat protein